MELLPKRDLGWIHSRNKDWEEKKSHTSKPKFLNEIKIRQFEPPDWYDRDMEYQYRKGFYHGIAEAADLIFRLYRQGGYVRPNEIGNIIGNWCNELRRWKSQATHEEPLKSFGHPFLKFKPWPELRKQVIQRDGCSCKDCGATKKLEVHHIEPVSEGGLPELDNLVTLCEECHKNYK